MGRPHIDARPNFWQQVDAMCQIQCTHDEICAVLQCNIDTLSDACKRKFGVNFSDYFQEKRAGGRMSLRRRQWKTTLDGNPTMQIWLGKNVLGQTDKNEVFEKSDVTMRASIAATQIDTRSYAQLEASARRLEKLIAAIPEHKDDE